MRGLARASRQRNAIEWFQEDLPSFGVIRTPSEPRTLQDLLLATGGLPDGNASLKCGEAVQPRHSGSVSPNRILSYIYLKDIDFAIKLGL